LRLVAVPGLLEAVEQVAQTAGATRRRAAPEHAADQIAQAAAALRLSRLLCAAAIGEHAEHHRQQCHQDTAHVTATARRGRLLLTQRFAERSAQSAAASAQRIAQNLV